MLCDGGATGRRERGGEKHLLFRLGAETYGVAILDVQEIVGRLETTRLPRAPDWVRGVVNLRGKIIPVVDLARRLGMPSAPETERTCIVIASPRGVDERAPVGFVVDDVCDVATVAQEDTSAPPAVMARGAEGVIPAIARLEERVVILLDLARLVASEGPLVVGSAELAGRVAEDEGALA